MIDKYEQPGRVLMQTFDDHLKFVIGFTGKKADRL